MAKTLSFVFIILCLQGLSQEQIEILNADDLIFDNSSGNTAKRLVGNVIMQHDNTLMYCDSAYLFDDNSSLEAYSNVRIEEGDSLEMTGAFLKYNGATKLALFSGGVTLTQDDMILLTPTFNYDRSANYGFYTQGGTIYTNEKQDTLTSKKGYYYSDLSEARFRDSVVLRSKSYQLYGDTLHYNSRTDRSSFYGPTKIIDGDQVILCERGWVNSKTDLSEFSKNAVIYSEDTELRGDTIRYNQDLGSGEAFGNVFMIDTSQNYYVRGGYAWHSKQDSLSIVTNEAEYVQVDDGDSLFLHGDSLIATYDTLKKRLIQVYNEVAFFKSDLQGRCDSMIMSDSDSSIHMYKDPIIWSDENQITGDYIRLLRSKSKIERMFIEEQAFICSEADSSKHNQIQGKRMEAFFAKNKLRKVLVYEKPKTIYYVEESDSSYLGLNTASANNKLAILLDSNRVEDLFFYEMPEGITNPMKGINASNNKLKGFIWKPEIRPLKREDIFIELLGILPIKDDSVPKGDLLQNEEN